MKYSKNAHSSDNLQGSFGPAADTGSNFLGFAQNAPNFTARKSEDHVLTNFLRQDDKFGDQSFSLSD